MYQELPHATPPLRTEPLGEQRCEGRFPRADRLVCHLVAALEEHLGDVAEAQLVAQPPEHREHHDVGREPDLVEARAGSLVEPAPARAALEPAVPELCAPQPAGRCSRSAVRTGHRAAPRYREPEATPARPPI